ncbi:MAG: cyanase [Pseudomonadales bacterium]
MTVSIESASEFLEKEDVTAMIIARKRERGLSWAAIADAISMSPVWTHSAAMGMQAMPTETAATLVALLDLPETATAVLEESPTKIWSQTVPTDPCIYRLYEIVGVYGPTIKALIHEEFGDGIMSAIDFEMSIKREPNPKGDRVKVEMSGKYLAYNAW